MQCLFSAFRHAKCSFSLPTFLSPTVSLLLLILLIVFPLYPLFRNTPLKGASFNFRINVLSWVSILKETS